MGGRFRPLCPLSRQSLRCLGPRHGYSDQTRPAWVAGRLAPFPFLHRRKRPRRPMSGRSAPVSVAVVSSPSDQGNAGQNFQLGWLAGTRDSTQIVVRVQTSEPRQGSPSSMVVAVLHGCIHFPAEKFLMLCRAMGSRSSTRCLFGLGVGERFGRRAWRSRNPRFQESNDQKEFWGCENERIIPP